MKFIWIITGRRNLRSADRFFWSAPIREIFPASTPLSTVTAWKITVCLVYWNIMKVMSSGKNIPPSTLPTGRVSAAIVFLPLMKRMWRAWSTVWIWKKEIWRRNLSGFAWKIRSSTWERRRTAFPNPGHPFWPFPPVPGGDTIPAGLCRDIC